MLVIQTNMFQISKYKRLLIMKEELIEVELASQRLRIEGKNLEITYMSIFELRGRGVIRKVTFL